ncbi:hypothetical protein [Sagittula sp. S175]|uniref:hypothetical protein n=1 Tax=Sagittula sp. S175 TaxID=3415129 RepID=UPI003C7A8067
MAETPKVTRNLLSAPLPDIIQRLGVAIAQAQFALDQNSVALATEMAQTEVEIGGDKYNLLSLGFVPSFYTFTEATVEAKLSFSMTESTEMSINVGVQVGGGTPFVMAAASVEVGYARKFSVSAEGMSSIAARLVSLPPPEIFTDLLRRKFENDVI